MRIPVFLSYPKPYLKKQQKFIDFVSENLRLSGFEPRTLGVTDYDMDAPLKGIRRLLLESNGLVTIAFRRSYIKNGTERPDSDMEFDKKDISGQWLTSPYCHIEPAMAFQLGLPVLVFREKDVIDDGILQKGVLGIYMPEFDLDKSEKKINEYFKTQEWNEIIQQWGGYVRSVVEHKGNPPRLY